VQGAEVALLTAHVLDEPYPGEAVHSVLTSQQDILDQLFARNNHGDFIPRDSLVSSFSMSFSLPTAPSLGPYLFTQTGRKLLAGQL
jgi:hypothetical protein